MKKTAVDEKPKAVDVATQPKKKRGRKQAPSAPAPANDVGVAS